LNKQSKSWSRLHTISAWMSISAARDKHD
jgi:hypothetical protein